jgi:hypothetical protein
MLDACARKLSQNYKILDHVGFLENKKEIKEDLKRRIFKMKDRGIIDLLDTESGKRNISKHKKNVRSRIKNVGYFYDKQ